MRNGTDLAQVHIAVGGQVRLTARDTASGRIQQTQPERSNCTRIGRAAQMLALMRADCAVEIEADIGAFVERVGADLGALRPFGHDPRKCRPGELWGCEVEVSVAALETDLGFKLNPIAYETTARPQAHWPG